jgi:glucoamylase
MKKPLRKRGGFFIFRAKEMAGDFNWVSIRVLAKLGERFLFMRTWFAAIAVLATLLPGTYSARASEVSKRSNRTPAMSRFLGKVGAFCRALFFKPIGTFEEWGQSRLKQAKERMEAGFRSTDGKIKGATKAAAIDPKGEYNGLWIRDNAINFKEVADQPDIEAAYIEFCRLNLATPTRGGLGEPKFNADGTAFNKDWGRPQNDGPAYRALRVMEYLDKKRAAGNLHAPLSYDPNLKVLSVKWDLEYLAHGWETPSYDLWEEELGTHFHTLAIISDALEEGAKFAARHEPGGAANPATAKYRHESKKIREKIVAESWDPASGYLRAVWKHDGGFVEKKEPLDIAVILGLLHATTEPPLFRLSDERVLATMAKLEERFSEIYRLNRRFDDPRFRGSAALGRYPEDVFHGGNPWVISTQGAGEYYFRLGSEIAAQGELAITATNQKFFARLLRSSAGSDAVRIGRAFRKGTREFRELLQAIQEKGDGFLEVVRSVTPPDGFHAEQIGRGYEPGDQGPWVAKYLELIGSDGSKSDAGGHWIGAQLLVWNEASFRSAWRSRGIFLEKMASLRR